VGVPGLAGVKLGVLPGGLNLPSYLALMPGQEPRCWLQTRTRSCRSSCRDLRQAQLSRPVPGRGRIARSPMRGAGTGRRRSRPQRRHAPALRSSQSAGRPRRCAARTACVRLVTPSAFKIALTWVLIVLYDTPKSAAISLLPLPRHMYDNTWSCPRGEQTFLRYGPGRGDRLAGSRPATGRFGQCRPQFLSAVKQLALASQRPFDEPLQLIVVAAIYANDVALHALDHSATGGMRLLRCHS